MSAHVKVMTMSTIGTVTNSRRAMKRNISSAAPYKSRAARLLREAVACHVGHTLIPLRLIVLDIDELPRMQRAGIRVHALHVRLLHPTRRGLQKRDDRRGFE